MLNFGSFWGFSHQPLHPTPSPGPSRNVTCCGSCQGLWTNPPPPLWVSKYLTSANGYPALGAPPPQAIKKCYQRQKMSRPVDKKPPSPQWVLKYLSSAIECPALGTTPPPSQVVYFSMLPVEKCFPTAAPSMTRKLQWNSQMSVTYPREEIIHLNIFQYLTLHSVRNETVHRRGKQTGQLLSKPKTEAILDLP